MVEERTRFGAVTAARHICIFLPKPPPPSCLAAHSHTPHSDPCPPCTQFHSELNWIERFWGAAKEYTRKHCLYTLPGLRETVPMALSQELSDVPADGVPVASVFKQRRWARISRQYMREYLKGADACEAVKRVAKKRSSRHRDPNDRRSGRVEAEIAARS